MTADDALALAARFGVVGRAARELAGGYSNDSWLVEEGDDARYVARRYGRLHVTRRALFYEHAVMAHAAARLTGVAAPLAADDGDSIVADPEGFGALLPFVPGTTGHRDAATRDAAARALARFHLAMRDFHAERPRVARTLGTLPWLRHRLLDFANDPALARAVDWDGLLTALAAATTRVAPLVRRLPLAVVHGDVHPENVVRNADAVTLIDFDFTHETERAYDVATGAGEFGRAHDDAPLDLERARAFVEAYASVAPLDEAEWAAIPALAVRRDATLAWYVVTRHGLRARGDVGNAPRYAARAREWRDVLARWSERRAAS